MENLPDQYKEWTEEIYANKGELETYIGKMVRDETDYTGKVALEIIEEVYQEAKEILEEHGSVTSKAVEELLTESPQASRAKLEQEREGRNGVPSPEGREFGARRG